MATDSMDTAAMSDSATPLTRRNPAPTRYLLGFTAAIVGGVGAVINTAYGFNGDDINLANIEKHGTMFALANGYGLALSMLTVIVAVLAVAALAPTRGSRWATAGLATGFLSSVLLCVGGGASLVLLYLTKPAAISTDAANSLVAYMNNNGSAIIPVIFPGFLLVLLTVILVTVAMLRARTIPMWVPIAFFVTSASTVVVNTGAIGIVLSVLQQTAVAVVCWYAWRFVKAAT